MKNLYFHGKKHFFWTFIPRVKVCLLLWCVQNIRTGNTAHRLRTLASLTSVAIGLAPSCTKSIHALYVHTPEMFLFIQVKEFIFCLNAGFSKFMTHV